MSLVGGHPNHAVKKLVRSIFQAFSHSLIKMPAPINLKYWWNYGSCLGLVLMVLVAIGATLVCHYIPSSEETFYLIQHRSLYVMWIGAHSLFLVYFFVYKIRLNKGQNREYHLRYLLICGFILILLWIIVIYYHIWHVWCTNYIRQGEKIVAGSWAGKLIPIPTKFISREGTIFNYLQEYPEEQEYEKYGGSLFIENGYLQFRAFYMRGIAPTIEEFSYWRYFQNFMSTTVYKVVEYIKSRGGGK